MSQFGVLLVSIAAFSHSPAAHSNSDRINQTPLQFVQYYLGELATFESIRRNALAEMKSETAPGMACVHNNTRYDLEVAAAILNLRHIHLLGVDSQVEAIPGQFAQLYEQRRKATAQLTAICTAFAEGPKDGVDYKGLLALMPKVRAQLEYLDNTALEASPLVFATLISDVPDSQGHASHLVITCDERKKLVAEIDDEFGAGTDADVSSNVRQARMIRKKVLEFKCADEPR